MTRTSCNNIRGPDSTFNCHFDVNLYLFDVKLTITSGFGLG